MQGGTGNCTYQPHTLFTCTHPLYAHKLWGPLLYSTQYTKHYWTVLSFWQVCMLPCGTSCIRIILRTPTQNHKCTLLIPSIHMISHNDNHKQNMETTIRRSHRMKYSWAIQDLIRVSSKTPPKSTPIHFQ